MTTSIPSANHGIVKVAQHEARLEEIPIPRLRDDYILVKTIAVALNPADWQDLDEPFRPGTTRSLLGIDAAGIVIEVGKSVTKSFKKGDRIAGCSHGANDLEPEDGTFAEYIVVKGDLAIKLPDHMSFEEGSTLLVGISTVMHGLYKHFDFPFPDAKGEGKARQGGEPILIYGGSSATGTLAIQFAKLSGLTVITTSSPRNFDLLKGLGADYVLDYNNVNIGQTIRSLTNDNLTKVLDTIAIPPTAQICAEALSSSSPNSVYVNLTGINFPRKDVKNVFFLGYTTIGEEFEYMGEVWKAVPEDFEMAKRFFALTEILLEKGLIKPHPVALRESGLKGILDGLKEFKKGGLSAVKLVYRIGEVDS